MKLYTGNFNTKIISQQSSSILQDHIVRRPWLAKTTTCFYLF